MEASVKVATTICAAGITAPASMPKDFEPSTSAAKTSWAAVLSLLTIMGAIVTGRAISQDRITAATIIRSRETTTITSQIGMMPTMASVM